MKTRLTAIFWAAALAGAALLAPACGGDDDPGATPTLDDFLPEVPTPTGEAQSVFAGPITADTSQELIPGPAASGRVGDFFLRNGRARFVIEAPTRVIGMVPQGGNLVDAVAVDDSGADVTGDHFGELSMIYLLGRSCDHQTVEVIQDGAGGGAAAIRAIGVARPNNALNIRGMDLLPVRVELDPDIDDGVTCATTYILEPDSDTLKVHWTLFNPREDALRGPLGMFNDVGGETESWSAGRGFERIGVDSLGTLTEPAPIDYVVYQGPGVAYGMLPVHPDPNAPNAFNSAVLVSGVSIVLYGLDNLFDILAEARFFLEVPAETGVTHSVDVVVGRDAADAEAVFRARRGETTAPVSGTVTFGAATPAAGARVGFFIDGDDNGSIDPDDRIAMYIDAAADGSFAGPVPPGNYLIRAEVKNEGRSEAISLAVDAAGAADVTLAIPEPVFFDYSIVDDETGNVIPGKITVIGDHPALPDERVFETFDRVDGMVAILHAIRGTTVDLGDGADPPLVLPPGATYRVMATRGTEWSLASQVITVNPGDPGGNLEFRLRRVAAADGYVSSEYHVHQIGSPDSPVNNELRVATAVADGVELFAATDHNFVSELQPVVEALGLERVVRAIVGIEVSPFAYGHFNAYPFDVDDTDPSHGAIDWAGGADGFAMIPGEIFSTMRERGARMVQVNHPRTRLPSDFLQYFDRAGLDFDYDARQILADMGPVPNDWLRLPGVSMWDDTFNAIELWNRFAMADSNGDGVREIQAMDVNMRDWFAFLSLGMVKTPVGNSDTHSAFKDPVGMPRTYVRVDDDSEAAIASGTILDEALDTLSGQRTRDVVVTNGPLIAVTEAGSAASAIGATLDAGGAPIDLDISVIAADWAVFDTIEIFANATPEIGTNDTALRPVYCFTSRDPATIAANDVCAEAIGGARPLTVQSRALGGGFRRLEATLTVTVDPADIAAAMRAGGTGQDAWLVVRARGDHAVFPLFLQDVITPDNLDVLVNGSVAEQEAALTGVGLPTTAFTAAIFIDFDGGGYTAAFSPQ